ncbi:Na+/H+ antiporter [Cupriavidus basilensis]|uniref:Na+/H+ antiporter n=1 Tax=Cupriavidus basilensis TaxID=68895 RepID=UPI000750FDB3|nr:Na+/H+ antiporter [Cupriavidus basilensis]
MSTASAFEFILVLVGVIIGLELLARRLHLPPAAALLAGGMAIAFLPGVPQLEFDPELILIIFLPPLLLDGAYFTVWEDFRRNLGGILWLAIGAVAFTTLAVGVVTHWLLPALPWAACFALGAVVSPPDAVAAKAVLERVSLPRRLMALLEGESLLNDAAGLVLFRFAIAAALTGAFSLWQASASFAVLGLGGVVVGGFIGAVMVTLQRTLGVDHLVIAASLLSPWLSYTVGESMHVSGVISTVTCGLIMGWRQHEVLSARIRAKGTAFWQVMVFLLEALVFILMGLSLRGVLARLGGAAHAFDTLALPVAAVVAAVVVSRFVWIFATGWLRAACARLAGRAARPHSAAGSAVLSWAGMRGVVTLAIALSVPESIPGRDLILAAAFAVILVTVLLQGSTLGLLIRALRLGDAEETNPAHLTESQVWAHLEAAQFKAVEALAYDAGGALIHPRLLEQYRYRADITARYSADTASRAGVAAEHYRVVLAAIAAGRAELLRLHRLGQIHDHVLEVLERDLDLQEIAAEDARG